jgi:hypothetical protein
MASLKATMKHVAFRSYQTGFIRIVTEVASNSRYEV